MSVYKQIPTLTPKQIDIFWSHVEVPYQPSCCWDWIGHLNDSGYGRIHFSESGSFIVHRIAYSLLIGEVATTQQIDHLCRNRRCVNPDHMDLVDCRTNTLRGYGLTAGNYKKTHCQRGHPFDDLSIEISKSGLVQRRCRVCKKLSWPQSEINRRKKKAKAVAERGGS